MFRFFKRKRKEHKYLDKDTIESIEDEFRKFSLDIGIEPIFKDFITPKLVRKRSEQLPVQEYLELLLNDILNIYEVENNIVKIVLFENNKIEGLDIGNGESLILDGVHTNYLYLEETLGGFVLNVDNCLLDNSEILFLLINYQIAMIQLGLTSDLFSIDCLSVFVGVGSLNVNSSFKFNKSNQGWTIKQVGYLNQAELLFALAIRTCLREDFEFDWNEFFNKSLKEEFDYNLVFIRERYKDLDAFFRYKVT